MALQIPLHCTISLRSLELLHCTPFSFKHSRCFTIRKKKHTHTHKLKKPSNFAHSMMHIFDPKQRAALALTKCYYITSLASDSTRFGALDSATQMTTSLKLKFTPNAFIYRFGHFVIKVESYNDVTQLSALFFYFKWKRNKEAERKDTHNCSIFKKINKCVTVNKLWNFSLPSEIFTICRMFCNTVSRTYRVFAM